MNRKLLALLMAAITPLSRQQYVKPGAVLNLNPGKGNAELHYASNRGWFGRMQYGWYGTANSCRRKPETFRWVWNDNASQCVAVISELKNGKANVMTRGCEGYCGAPQ